MKELHHVYKGPSTKNKNMSINLGVCCPVYVQIVGLTYLIEISDREFGLLIQIRNNLSKLAF